MFTKGQKHWCTLKHKTGQWESSMQGNMWSADLLWSRGLVVAKRTRSRRRFSDSRTSRQSQRNVNTVEPHANTC